MTARSIVVSVLLIALSQTGCGFKERAEAERQRAIAESMAAQASREKARSEELRLDAKKEIERLQSELEAAQKEITKLKVELGKAKVPSSTVRGKIAYRGKPLVGGVITFHSEKGSLVGAAIEPDGSYQAMAVPQGQATVTVTLPRDPTEEIKNLIVPIPLKYSQPHTSSLKVDVKKAEETFDIQLK